MRDYRTNRSATPRYMRNRGSKSPLYQPAKEREPAVSPLMRRVRHKSPPPKKPIRRGASRRRYGAFGKVDWDARAHRWGAKVHGVREAVIDIALRAGYLVRRGAYLAGVWFAAILTLVVVLLVMSLAINGVARWNARRVAGFGDSAQGRIEKARDNLLIVAVDKTGRASGFLAIRVDRNEGSIYGIAIPDATFIEVPGQGFERVGVSWDAGPDVSLDAISNFFGVPFTAYARVDPAVYQSALTKQSFEGVSNAFAATNLDKKSLERFTEAFNSIPTENVAIVPMPVRPITLGNQTYFEPQRQEIADLVETWWGARINGEQAPTRVIVYNGSGVPGIAGIAAQELIRGGLRVVDTKNADRFDYRTTSIIVQNGPVSAGEQVRTVLGVGKVVEQAADQQVADIVVIIGKDYRPDTQP